MVGFAVDIEPFSQSKILRNIAECSLSITKNTRKYKKLNIYIAITNQKGKFSKMLFQHANL